MLHIVAIPVHEKVSVPGPWYSTMAPVPPLTVRISATFRIMSVVLLISGSMDGWLTVDDDRQWKVRRYYLPLGAVQPLS